MPEGLDHQAVFGGGHAQGGVAHHFRERRGVGTHHRRAAGHGFQRREAESLRQREEDERRGAAVQGRQQGVVHPAGPVDPRRDHGRTRRPENPGIARLARQHQPHVVGQLRQEPGPDLQQGGQVFPRLDGPKGKHIVSAGKAQGPGGGLALLRGTGREAGADTVRDHHDPLRRDPGARQDPAAGIFGRGDDPAHPAGQPGDQASEQPGEPGGEPLGVVQRDDVVDGDHLLPHPERTGDVGTPQQAPPPPSRQQDLVPEQVLQSFRLPGPAGAGPPGGRSAPAARWYSAGSR